MNIKQSIWSVIILGLISGFFTIASAVIPFRALAQNKPTDYMLVCLRGDHQRKIYIVTDILFVPDEGVFPYNLGTVYGPKFHDFIKAEGLDPSNGDCFGYPQTMGKDVQDHRLKLIEKWKQTGYKIIELKGWHPNKPNELKYVANTGPMPAQTVSPATVSTKRDSVIVRTPDETSVKPVSKPKPKPVSTAKPAAKPVPKKPLKPCTRKGSCAKPM